MKDLFETPELIPAEVKAIMDTFNDYSGNEYLELDRIVNELNQIGYTFDFYLDAEPYGLRPINVKLEDLDGYQD